MHRSKQNSRIDKKRSARKWLRRVGIIVFLIMSFPMQNAFGQVGSTPAIVSAECTPSGIFANGLSRTQCNVRVDDPSSIVTSVVVDLDALNGYQPTPLTLNSAGGGLYQSFPVTNPGAVTAQPGTIPGIKQLPVTVFYGAQVVTGTLDVEILAAPLAPDCDTEWHMYACNIHHSANSLSTVTLPLQEKWTYQADPTAYVWSSPIVAGGRVFAADSQGDVYAINEADGQQVWRVNLGAAIWCTITYGDGRIYVAATDGVFYALNAASGATVWQTDVGQSIANKRPVYHDGRVFFSSSNPGTLVCLNAVTGAMEWSQNSGGTDMSSAPLIVNGIAYAMGTCPSAASCPNNHVIGVDILTGQIVATYDMPNNTGHTLSYGNGRLYLITMSGTFFAFDTSLNILYTSNIQSSAGPPPTYDRVRDRVYVGTYANAGGRKIKALNAATGAELWSHLMTGYTRFPPFLAGDGLYVYDINGILEVLDPDTGAAPAGVVNPIFDLNGIPGGDGLTLAGDTFYLSTADGRVVAVAAAPSNPPRIDGITLNPDAICPSTVHKSVITVQVSDDDNTPGTCDNIRSVTADITAIRPSNPQIILTNPGGDCTFTNDPAVNPITADWLLPPGSYNVNVTVTDMSDNTADGTTSITIRNCVDETPCTDNWPYYSCNLTRSGFNQTSTLAPPLEQFCNFNPTITDAVAGVGPVIENGIAYYANWAGYLFAVNLDDCTELWRQKLNGPIYRGTGIYDGKIYAGTWSGTFYGFDALTGAPVGTFTAAAPTSFIDTLPVGSDGIVVAGNGREDSGHGGIYFHGFDANTLNVLWTLDVNALLGAYGTACAGDNTPVIYNGIVYFSTCELALRTRYGAVIAVDLYTGSPLWKFQDMSAIGSLGRVTLYDGVLYFANNNHYIYALDAETGTQIWRSGPYNNLSQGCNFRYIKDSPDDLIVCSTGHRSSAIFLKASNGSFVQEYPDPPGYFASNSAYANGYLYFPGQNGNTDRNLYILRPELAVSDPDFAQLYTFDTAVGSTSPAIAGDVICVSMVGDGSLRCLRSQQASCVDSRPPVALPTVVTMTDRDKHFLSLPLNVAHTFRHSDSYDQSPDNGIVEYCWIWDIREDATCVSSNPNADVTSNPAVEFTHTYTNPPPPGESILGYLKVTDDCGMSDYYGFKVCQNCKAIAVKVTDAELIGYVNREGVLWEHIHIDTTGDVQLDGSNSQTTLGDAITDFYWNIRKAGEPMDLYNDPGPASWSFPFNECGTYYITMTGAGCDPESTDADREMLTVCDPPICQKDFTADGPFLTSVIKRNGQTYPLIKIDTGTTLTFDSDGSYDTGPINGTLVSNWMSSADPLSFTAGAFTCNVVSGDYACTYPNPGIYIVELETVDADGLTDTCTEYVAVGGPPVAVKTTDPPAKGVLNLGMGNRPVVRVQALTGTNASVDFDCTASYDTSLSGTIKKCQWDFYEEQGGNYAMYLYATRNEALADNYPDSFTKTFPSEGIYRVVLTVYDDEGNTDTDEEYIYVYEAECVNPLKRVTNLSDVRWYKNIFGAVIWLVEQGGRIDFDASGSTTCNGSTPTKEWYLYRRGSTRPATPTATGDTLTADFSSANSCGWWTLDLNVCFASGAPCTWEGHEYINACRNPVAVKTLAAGSGGSMDSERNIHLQAGDQLTLDGAASWKFRDPSNLPVDRYQWWFGRKGGTLAEICNGAAQCALPTTFSNFPEDCGVYEIRLTVFDNQLFTASGGAAGSDTEVETIYVCRQPTARKQMVPPSGPYTIQETYAHGRYISIAKDTHLYFDASGSSGNGTSIDDIRWTLNRIQPDFSAIATNLQVTPAFTNPYDYVFDACGWYELIVIVTNGEGLTDSHKEHIAVCYPPAAVKEHNVTDACRLKQTEHYGELILMDAGDTVTFTGDKSRDTDPTGTIDNVIWRLDGLSEDDTMMLDVDDTDPYTAYVTINGSADCGLHSISLTVVDDDGQTDTETEWISACRGPVAVKTSNRDNERLWNDKYGWYFQIEPGDTINFDGNRAGNASYDPQADCSNDPVSGYQWEVKAPLDTAWRDLGGASSRTINFDAANNLNRCGWYQVRLTVTDSDGYTNSSAEWVHLCAPPVIVKTADHDDDLWIDGYGWVFPVDKGETINFDISKSYDTSPGGSIALYHWRIDAPDGRSWEGPDDTFSRQFDACGLWRVTVKVEDDSPVNPQTAADTEWVRVCDVPVAVPREVNWQCLPSGHSLVSVDHSLSIGDIDRYCWDFTDPRIVGVNPIGDATGAPNQTCTSVSDRIFEIELPECCGVEEYNVVLTVYDDTNNTSDSAVLTINPGDSPESRPKVVDYNAWNFPGIPVTFDGYDSFDPKNPVGVDKGIAAYWWVFWGHNDPVTERPYTHHPTGAGDTPAWDDYMNNYIPNHVVPNQTSWQFMNPYPWSRNAWLKFPQHEYEEAGDYRASLYVWDEQGCPAVRHATVHIGTNNCSSPCIPGEPQTWLPPVAVAGLKYYAVQGEPVLLRGDKSYDVDGVIVQNDWTFGDGREALGTGMNVSHTYAFAGTYIISLRVVDDDGLENTEYATVIVQPAQQQACVTNVKRVTKPNPLSAHYDPAVFGSQMAWTENVYKKIVSGSYTSKSVVASNVMRCDLDLNGGPGGCEENDAKIRVTSNTDYYARDTNVRVSDDKIVWIRTTSGNSVYRNDVMMCDIPSGQCEASQPKTNLTQSMPDPLYVNSLDIFGDRVVWIAYEPEQRQSFSQVYAYTISTGSIDKLTTGQAFRYNAVVAGDRVAWIDTINVQNRPCSDFTHYARICHYLPMYYPGSTCSWNNASQSCDGTMEAPVPYVYVYELPAGPAQKLSSTPVSPIYGDGRFNDNWYWSALEISETHAAWGVLDVTSGSYDTSLHMYDFGTDAEIVAEEDNWYYYSQPMHLHDGEMVWSVYGSGGYEMRHCDASKNGNSGGCLAGDLKDVIVNSFTPENYSPDISARTIAWYGFKSAKPSFNSTNSVYRTDSCPPGDADNDGLFDGADQCPTSPYGAAVDAQGCAYTALGYIKPYGGAVASEDGSVRIDVPIGPDGNNDVLFSIERGQTTDDALQAQGLTTVGPVINLSPDGITFNPPVTVTVAYDCDGLSLAEKQSVALYTYDGSNWVDTGAVNDTGECTLTVPLSHFTHFAPAGVIDTDDDGNDDSVDNCVYEPNSDQTDCDGDGIGDACDVDTNAPSMSYSGPEPGAWSNEPVTLEFSAQDDACMDSSVVEFRMCVGLSCIPIIPLVTEQTETGAVASATFSADMDDLVRFVAVDGAGNLSAPIDLPVRIDTMAPATPTITTPASGTISNDPAPEIRGQAEPGSAVDIYLEQQVEDILVVQANADPVTGQFATATYVTDSGDLSPDGIKTLYAVARDQAGNTSEPSDPVKYILDTTPPATCRFLQPEPFPRNMLFGAETDVVVEAQDANGVQFVAFSYEGGLQGQAQPIGNSLYELEWNFANEPTGWHDISTSCTDVAGNTAEDAMRVRFIYTLAPEVTILTPADGEPVLSTFTVTVSYKAPRHKHVTLLELYDGDQLLDSQFTFEPEGQTSFTVSLPIGDHALRAKAYMGPAFLRLVGVSDIVTVTVTEELPPLEITDVYNYPEPFDVLGVTVYARVNRRAGEVEFRVFDASGTPIAELSGKALYGGMYTAHWNGREGGYFSPQAPPGPYTIRVVARSGPEEEAVRELVITKEQ